ncbi:MAG: ABC transporter ATP-binding protein [Candidatus Krumholzibacteria bacterium]|nr:ABC transporter ATP-binding protein [Candidatus Krumholzibacteria bacterium]MDH4336603.1 ABC transporter ATP-binding protein [Candidatus Krumholzibacteria bacterium]MDH5268946.1 ABC transporter ATP-binding protein [Candidatus Krumholzibacteria bacterium]MDH5627565.1 ABC transporter ATP-binding protein [Candidatus Krumholzibacteria bacterium]
MVILELHGIRKSFRQGFWGVRTPVLQGVDLSLEQGEVFGFLGHNGAGKSTTMKAILGLIRPDAGSVTIFGQDGASERTRARMGYLGEEVGLYPQITGPEMLLLVGRLFRLPRAVVRRRADELIELVGLGEKRSVKIRHYSKGMKQRLGIATALMNDPELLLLDEPYSGLDPVGRKQLRELLIDLKRQGKTIMMSSHIVPDVEAVCDRVGILSGGRIARVLDLREVYADQNAQVEVTFSGVDRRRLQARDYGAREVFAGETVTIVRCDETRLKDLVADVYAAEGHVVEVKPLRTRLEDVFVDAVREFSPAAPDPAKRDSEPVLTRR